MTLELSFRFEKGKSLCLLSGRALHSLYDPEKEALRWAEAINAEPETLFFLLGDALGYAEEALVSRSPTIKILSLLPSAECRNHRRANQSAGFETTWCPQDGDLETFLRKALETWGPETVRWEVWPTFERLASSASLRWSETFRNLYRQVQGSWLTYRRFGSSFWKNTLRNLIEWEQPQVLKAGTKPILIAASGPSLEDGRDWIKRHRARFDLWALPSSFEALSAWGITPDAGIATDGGYYAREHLRRLQNRSIPVFAAASSAADPTLSARPLLLFSQGYAPEKHLLPLFEVPYLELPSQGTVAVTGVRLAVEATSGPVLVAGMDLCYRDLKAHATPHTFDRVLQPTKRTKPWETLLFERRLQLAPVDLPLSHEKTSPAMLTYAIWLREKQRFRRPVYRIAPTEVEWSSMNPVSWSQAETLLGPGGTSSRLGTPDNFSWPAKQDRKRRLIHWLEVTSQNLIEDATREPVQKLIADLAETAAPAELSAWLKKRRAFPDGQVPPRQPLAKAIAEFFQELAESLR